MKKALIAIAAVLLAAATLKANPVTPQEAARLAATFWQHRYGTPAAMALAPASASYPGLYILNNTKNPGFVIIAADDRATPILGYSDEQHASDNIPVSVDAWLRDYSDAVLYCVSHDIEATEEIVSQWGRLREGAPIDDPDRPHNTVAALLTTTWNQSPRYNNLCPYDNTARERTVTGCVATAMAQVMKFWNSPIVGVSSNAYNHTTYGNLSADFSSTYYAWSQMPNALSASSSTAQINAVATLMYHCGVAVEMDFDISANGGSGAQTIAFNNSRAVCAENALKTYFDYKSTLRGYERSNTTESVWTQRVITELDASRPVIYTGRDASGGHCFVCDGYDSRNYFHMNWGWGGSYNGYFALNALNPGGGGTGSNSTYTFNSGQTMIIGIEPNSSTLRVTPNQLNFSGLGASDSVFVRSSNSDTNGWTATCSQQWLSFSPLSGNGSGQQTVMRISAPQNTTGRSRTAFIVITQGTFTDTVSITQPNGNTSQTGWYGRDNGAYYIGFDGGDQFVIRPEALGNFPAGSLLSQVKFTTYGASGYANNRFTVKVFEGSSLNAGILSSGYTNQVNACLGTLVRSQQYTLTSHGEQVVTLNDPYVVTSRPFWIAVEPAGSSAILCDKRVVNCTLPPSQIPLVDSLDGRYLHAFTSNGTYYLTIAYGSEYTNNSRTQAVEYNRDFALAFYINTNPTYTITVSSANNALGTVTGGGSFRYGDTVLLRATPATDCHFNHWDDGDTTNPRLVIVRGSANYIAHFGSNNCTITVSSANPSMGSATGSGTFRYGTTTTISATANSGYRFTGWNDGNGQNPRTVNVSGDAIFIATFAGVPYTITAAVSDANAGYTTGSGQYNYGTTATIQAYPYAGYTFTGWNDGNTDNPRTVTVSGDATYTASFSLHTVVVSVVADDPSHGVVTGSGTYREGDSATLSAAPLPGHRFRRWNIDGRYNFANPHYLPITAEMSGTVNVIAEFTTNTHRLTLSTGGVNEPNNRNLGTASGDGTYDYGTQVTITATPRSGNHFEHWNDGNTANPRTITIVSDTSFKALFDRNESIDAANHANPVIMTAAGTITIVGAANMPVDIYDALGRHIHHLASAPASLSLNVPAAGLYIVKIAGIQPTKVVVTGKNEK